MRSILEGRLGRFFGARVQPVDIARALAERMEDDVAIGAGRRYAPNVYRVFLSPATLAAFESYRTVLEEELAAGLGARGAARGLDFVGRIRVHLLADAAVRPERSRIEADRVDRHGVVVGGVGSMTEAIRVDSARAERPVAMVIRHGERTVALPIDPAASVSIGRGLDSDIVIDGGMVSRRHARLTARGTHWMIEDLESTHGTWVNGQRISATVLRDGDRISLGAAVLHFAATGATASGPAKRSSGGSGRDATFQRPPDAPDASDAPDGPDGPDARNVSDGPM